MRVQPARPPTTNAVARLPSPWRNPRRPAPAAGSRPAPTCRSPSAPQAGFIVADNLVRASRIEIRQRRAVRADFQQPVGQPGRSPTPQPLALQPLGECLPHGVGQCLSGEGGGFPGQPVGLLVLQAQRHATLRFLEIAGEYRKMHARRQPPVQPGCVAKVTVNRTHGLEADDDGNHQTPVPGVQPAPIPVRTATAEARESMRRSGMLGRTATSLPLAWWDPIAFWTNPGILMIRNEMPATLLLSARNAVCAMPLTADSNPRGATWDVNTGLITAAGDNNHLDATDNLRLGQVSAGPI